MSLEQQIQTKSEEFHTLFSRLSDTKWSEAAIPEAQSRLKACQNQARLIQDKINAFNMAADKEHKRLSHIKGHGARHVWYKVRGKLEQRLDEQERIWLQEFEKCKEEEQRFVVLQEEIHSAQKYLNQCQDAYEEYTKTKQALNTLMEYFFSGATPTYPDEDIMEQNLKKEQERLIALQSDHSVLTYVFHLLEKAQQALIVARQELDNALNMNTFDLFSHSAFVDIAESSHLAKARNASAQAQQLLNQAKHEYRNMPQIGDLHIKQDNLVFNIMFDNIWTDMNMRQMICEASGRISRAHAVLTNILLEIKLKLLQCKFDQDQTSNDVKRLAAEHFTARVAIVQNIIEPPPEYSPV
jgi:hypothetical protein